MKKTSKRKYRNCPLCGSNNKNVLYKQKFAERFSHRIVFCNNCSFIFVDNTPSNKYYKKYYRSESKYEGVRAHEEHEPFTTKVLIEFLKNNLNNNTKILDVGCSTGSLLSKINIAGYSNLLGIEPAPKCKKIAKDKFGIKVQTTNLESYSTNQKFDLIIFSQVLEHILDIKKGIKKISSLLKEEGYLLIGVPNTDCFYKSFNEPFGEFSTEHINFFTLSSLYSLMHDFTLVQTRTKDNILITIWQKGNSGKRNILRYIDDSNNKMVSVQNKIDKLPSNIIVWGAGSLTRKLLINSKFKNKILFIVDSDEKHYNKTLKGINILPPNEINAFKLPIFISSYRFQNEIKKELSKMGYLGKIYVL